MKEDFWTQVTLITVFLSVQHQYSISMRLSPHQQLSFSINVYYLKNVSAPCFLLQASIVTVIRLVNDAVDTIESEGTMSYLSCVSSLAVPVLNNFSLIQIITFISQTTRAKLIPHIRIFCLCSMMATVTQLVDVSPHKCVSSC